VTVTRASRRAQLFPAPFEALAYQNLAINPRHVLSQANGANVVSVAAPAGAYVTDGHILATAGASFTLTGQQVAAPFATRPDIKNGVRIGVSVAKTALVSGDVAAINVPVEGWRSRRLAWGTANGKSLAFGVMMLSSVSGAFYVNVGNAYTTSRSYFQKVTLVANQETFVPLVFPPCPDGAWASDNTLGLVLRVVLAAGSAFQGAANSWQTSNLVAASDQVNFLASTANALTISDLILLPMAEGAADATQLFPIERLPLFERHFDDELRLCQRYWTSSYDYGTAPGTASADPSSVWGYAGPIADANSYFGVMAPFPVAMRAPPTVTVYNPHTGAAGSAWLQNAAVSASATIGLAAIKQTFLVLNNVSVAARDMIKFHYVADARL
jgi:hypothetical protein